MHRPVGGTDLAFASATELAAAIRRREIGCAEALEMYLERGARYDGTLNAVVVHDVERARARARELDARGESRGILHGVPITVKESFDVAGLPTTYGLCAFRDNVPLRSALAVRRLEAAGAVVFGKTNVPRSLLDWQAFNDLYGRTNNPWDLTKTPGGSSGGSAAALAAGLTALELGSDIGGSIRVPAHFTGLFGHKPSWGLLPMLGHSLTGSVTPTDIAVIGPLARSADDLDLALDLLAQPDPADTAGRWQLPADPARELRTMRIAVWADDPAAPTDPEITSGVVALADELRARGADVREARPPIDTARAFTLYLELLAAALGHRLAPEALAQARERAAADPAADDPDAILDRNYEMPHGRWLGLDESRHQLRRRWQQFFEGVDVLLCPPFATPALDHDTTSVQRERRTTVAGRRVPYDGLGFWAGIVGMAWLPATVAPLGLTRAGLPIGVQIVGPLHGDRRTIGFARLLEREWRAFARPPGPWA